MAPGEGGRVITGSNSKLTDVTGGVAREDQKQLIARDYLTSWLLTKYSGGRRAFITLPDDKEPSGGENHDGAYKRARARTGSSRCIRIANGARKSKEVRRGKVDRKEGK